jgi:tryptophan synthase beta chain
MTRGEFAYDFGDVAGMTPLLPMHTLGHQFIPPAIHAGGLRYHGMAPLVSQAIIEGLMRPVAFDQLHSYEAAITWARTEGYVIAPETSTAVACVIEEALKAKKEGQEKVILFNLSGHGLLDLSGYDKYLSGKLESSEVSEEEIKRSLARLPQGVKAQKRKSGKW